MENNFLETGLFNLQVILNGNEDERKRLLKEIDKGNKKVYKSKKAIVDNLTKGLLDLLPDGLGKKLLQSEGYIHCYIGGGNVMAHQKDGQLLQALIKEAITIDPANNSKMYISETHIYASEIYIESLGIRLYGDEINSINKIVEEINIKWLQLCKISVKSDGSPDKPSYQCFTIKLPTLFD